MHKPHSLPTATGLERAQPPLLRHEPLQWLHSWTGDKKYKTRSPPAPISEPPPLKPPDSAPVPWQHKLRPLVSSPTTPESLSHCGFPVKVHARPPTHYLPSSVFRDQEVKAMVEAWEEFGKATGVAELPSVALLQSSTAEGSPLPSGAADRERSGCGLELAPPAPRSRGSGARQHGRETRGKSDTASPRRDPRAETPDVFAPAML
ncbi:unnamed protein product [Arctogadus glacialis]